MYQVYQWPISHVKKIGWNPNDSTKKKKLIVESEIAW